MSVVVAEFNLNIDIDSFVTIFWKDIAWYDRFLCDGLGDINVNISEWECMNTNQHVADNGLNLVMSRKIHSYHPSKMSFPGLPSHAEVRVIAYLF